MGENKDWRVELNRAGVGLHELLSEGMPADNPDDWVHRLEDQLGELSRALTGFCSDCDLGLFDECIELAPRLVPQVNKIRTEQVQLQASVQQQIQKLHTQQPDSSLERSMADIVHRVDQLNHHAVDVVYSAYETDLGGPG
ncbi:MAG: hypothetical protein F4124_01640 [Acidimicrobiia bacterium]|nr:hypothetical protein [bacterium]MXW57658.1 hypothetical protein [Acidimicrobiia bacterium]MDE0613773.1 hypothetical protein [bacterium]MXZ78008.1 hypothetical protein [Acidimicrobiia bacterium]MXZ84654.1 hypothetical protein [Acidimicrobiia bacterium]